MIFNNFKLNMILQGVMVFTFLFACTCTYWTHIPVEATQGDVQVTIDYSFTCLTLRANTEYATYKVTQEDFTWIATVYHECKNTSIYPDSVCKRSLSLLLGGIFVSKLSANSAGAGVHADCRDYDYVYYV